VSDGAGDAVTATGLKQAISSPDAPSAIGAYSPAIRAGNLLFVSGQVPMNPATGTRRHCHRSATLSVTEGRRRQLR